jgi:lactaldehyde reductase
VHATAHALGALYGIPHGLANSIMLPIVMEFNVKDAPERYMMIADAMGLDVAGKKPLEAARMAVKAVKSLKKKVGLTDTLKDFKVPKDPEKLKPLVELAAADGQISYNPHYLEEADILKLYNNAY